MSFQAAHGQRGSVVNTSLTTTALEGNALGNSTTRRARVYLPPGYDSSSRRYPVIYYLHGAFGDHNEFYGFSGNQIADQLIQEGTAGEMIIVGVNGDSRSLFSSYVNSEYHGNFEDYIVQDLVSHIDSTYRTIADRDSRGIFGVSMGGYGAMRYGLTHSDVFGASYSHSSGYVSLSEPGSFLYLGGDKAVFADGPNAGSDLAAVRSPSDIRGRLRSLVFGWASGFSPNLDKPPLNVDLPFELPGLDIIPEIREKWMDHDVFTLLENHVADASTLRGLAFDVGNQDSPGILPTNEALHQALLDANVPHQFEVFSGGHVDKIDERLAISLKFFSDTLVTLFGDFNDNGSLDADDIDLLSAEVRRGSNNPGMDVTGDGLVDKLDREFWVKEPEIAHTYFGDSNLDGEFNSGDLISVFQAGQYEDHLAANSSWAAGDWNGDAEFGTADLVFAFQDGGYERGPRAAVNAVPEPASGHLFFGAAILTSYLRRHRHFLKISGATS